MPDISSVLNASRSLANNFVPFLVTAVAVVAGLLMIYSGISDMYHKGSASRMASMGHQDASYGGIALKLLIGGMMLRLGSTVGDISELLTGSGTQDIRGVLAYAPVTQTAKAAFWMGVFEVCLLWVLMLGWLGAFRGLMLWHKAAAGSQSGGSAGDLFFQGFWHLLGGAAAVNLAGMIKAFLGG